MNTTSRVKKVYHLRKTVSSLKNKQKPQQKELEKQQVSQFKAIDNEQNNQSITMQNNSMFKKNLVLNEDNYPIEQETKKYVDGPEIVVNTLYLNFQEKLDYIQTKEIKVKNIGSSAVYYQWKFKNQPKINPNAIKDIKPKFFCHYSKQSIKPGEQITFIFSFVSEIPGYFTEQCQLLCQPALNTPIPIIRLQGKAYIDDQWQQQRANFLRQLQQSVRQCSIQQTVNDLIDQVKLPQPQKPNVKDPKIAQQIFQKSNQNLKLYFNPLIHGWFNELFQEVWKKEYSTNENEQIYWDQSIQTFKSFINNCKNADQVEKICYLQRLEHYTHLSTFPLPNKSQLYQTVYNMVSDAAYRLGGDHADAAKKQLDMWQVPFRQPLQTDTQEDLKTRKQQVQKIKAQWLKRTKKKKWGEQQQKQMMQQFRTKVRSKTNQQILQKFAGFQDKAQYTKIQKVIQSDAFNPQKYFLFLQRMKTVNQYSLEGKKVFLKFNLKLKNNCQKQLQQLNQYLVKKQEQKKKLQQEKKNLDTKKKKPAAKKKGQKQQEEQKPLAFDFSTILDQQNWNGFLDTFRCIQQKSPYLILIGCTYRDRIGRNDPNLTVNFLLQHLKTIEPSIQFLTHQQLYGIKQNIQNQSIGQGSIFLVQNLNFLPSQTLTCQQVQSYQQDGIQKQKITKRNVIYPEIRNDLDVWATAFDVIVDQDKYVSKPSGISTYSHLQVILGKTWWNYVALSLRVQNQNVILSGDFNPESYLLINRLLKYTNKIYLTGLLGAKFRMALSQVKSFCNISITQNQIALIKQTFNKSGQQKLFVPSSFKLLSKQKQGQQQQNSIIKTLQHKFSQDTSNYQLIDIDDRIGRYIYQNSNIGHFFMIGKSHITQYNEKLYGMNSTTQILKNVYKIQQQKRSRHSIEVNTPAGIDFNKDFVFYLVGIDEKYVQSIELKDKKVKIIEKGDQQEQAAEQNEEQDEQENQKKKIDLVADFKLFSQEILLQLFSGKFQQGLKNISKYPKPRII